MRVRVLGTGAADGWPNPWCGCPSCAWARAEPARVRTHTAALLDDTLLVDCGPDVARQADRAGVGLAGVRAVLLTHGHWDHADPVAMLARGWAGAATPLRVLGPASALERFASWRDPAGAEGPDGDSLDGLDLVALRPGDELDVAGYRVRALAAAHRGGGATPEAGADPDAVVDEALLYDITGPHGARLLYATDTAVPGPETLDAVSGAAYDLVLLDETFGRVTGHATGHLDLATFPLALAELRRRGAVTARTDVIAVHLGHHNPPGPELDRVLGAWGARTVPDLATVEVGDPAPALRPTARPRRELVLGGARSGKSRHAEARLAAEPAVTYLATGGVRAADPEWAGRVAAHRARRPGTWTTVETTDVAGALRALPGDGAMLVDCLALWLADRLDTAGAWEAPDARDEHRTSDALDRVERDVAELVAAVRAARGRVVLVSNEVGSGVVPEHASGRLYRDLLGDLNARVATACDEVTLLVAGRALSLGPRDDRPGPGGWRR